MYGDFPAKNNTVWTPYIPINVRFWPILVVVHEVDWGCYMAAVLSVCNALTLFNTDNLTVTAQSGCLWNEMLVHRTTSAEDTRRTGHKLSLRTNKIKQCNHPAICVLWQLMCDLRVKSATSPYTEHCVDRFKGCVCHLKERGHCLPQKEIIPQNLP